MHVVAQYIMKVIGVVDVQNITISVSSITEELNVL